MLNYLNPSPDKEVIKLSVWIRNSSGTNAHSQAYEMGTGYIPFNELDSTGDTYNQEAILRADSDSNFLKLKEITLPQSELLEGVMNEIKTGGQGTSYCKIKFVYDDETELFDAINNSVNTINYTPKWYLNPNTSKKVKRIEVWGKTSSNLLERFLYERRTSIVRMPYYHFSNPPSYITFRLPQYEETDTHFKVKVDAVREAGDSIWFEIFDGENNQTYAATDFEKFHALPAGITKPDKLRIYMVPAPENNNRGLF